MLDTVWRVLGKLQERNSFRPVWSYVFLPSNLEDFWTASVKANDSCHICRAAGKRSCSLHPTTLFSQGDWSFSRLPEVLPHMPSLPYTNNKYGNLASCLFSWELWIQRILMGGILSEDNKSFILMKNIPKVILYRSEGKQSICEHARLQTSGHCQTHITLYFWTSQSD